MSAENRALRPDTSRAVITGYGAITPIGNSAATYWESLVAGRSGAGPITHFDASANEVRIAAEVKDFDPTHTMEMKMARRMSRFVQFAVAAATEAIEHAGLATIHEWEAERRDRVATIINTGGGGIEQVTMGADAFRERGGRFVSPFAIPALSPSMGACMVSMKYGLTGAAITQAAACATGVLAFQDALRLIRKLLRPGGLLLVNYPDIDTWVAKALGDRWPYWLSVHLDYYTPATLTRQLANAGFIARSYTPSWKTLPFGYVAQRAEPYVGPFKPLLKLVDALGLSNVNLPHFVGQTLAVCEAVGTGFDTRAKQTAEPTPSERRSDTRVKAEQELTVRNLANDTVQVGILHDLSGSGLRATVTEEIPAGTSVRIEGPDVLLLGEVVRCTAENENFTLGVKLQHTLNGLKALQDWAQAYRDEAQALREESLPR